MRQQVLKLHHTHIGRNIHDLEHWNRTDKLDIQLDIILCASIPNFRKPVALTEKVNSTEELFYILYKSN